MRMGQFDKQNLDYVPDLQPTTLQAAQLQRKTLRPPHLWGGQSAPYVNQSAPKVNLSNANVKLLTT